VTKVNNCAGIIAFLICLDSFAGSHRLCCFPIFFLCCGFAGVFLTAVLCLGLWVVGFAGVRWDPAVSSGSVMAVGRIGGVLSGFPWRGESFVPWVPLFLGI
jgi:type IV secretory pathway VirB3-like protein